MSLFISTCLRRLTGCLGLVAAMAWSAESPGPGQWVVTTNQANHRIECYDSTLGDWNRTDAVRWSFAAELPGYTPREVKAWQLPSDAKFRTTAHWPGTSQVMVAVASGGLATIASFPAGKPLWSAIVGGNPHAAELLPDGNLAVAASHGNYVRVYTSSQGPHSERYTEFKLEDAHAVAWDPTIGRLWVLGRIPGGEDVITALIVSGTAAQPILEEDRPRRRALPSPGPHDLTACPGDSHQSWISCVSRAYLFNRDSGSFTELPGLAQGEDIKALSNFPGGPIVQTRKTGGCHEWTTDTVLFFDPVTGRKTGSRQVRSACFYKARAWTDQYR